MNCPHCTAPNDDNAWKCTNCGREVRSAPAALPPAAHGIPNYLIPAILSTVFCCWPLGIPAIVFAARVNEQIARGDVVGAQDSSRKARLFTLLSVVAIAVLGIGYLLLLVAIGGLAGLQ